MELEKFKRNFKEQSVKMWQKLDDTATKMQELSEEGYLFSDKLDSEAEDIINEFNLIAMEEE